MKLKITIIFSNEETLVIYTTKKNYFGRLDKNENNSHSLGCYSFLLQYKANEVVSFSVEEQE